jgi:hypothetical protein
VTAPTPSRDAATPPHSNTRLRTPASEALGPRELLFFLEPRTSLSAVHAPGVVETDMSNFTKTDGGRDFTLGMQALKRLAQPYDIGGVIAFRACEGPLDHGRDGPCRRRLEALSLDRNDEL